MLQALEPLARMAEVSIELHAYYSAWLFNDSMPYLVLIRAASTAR